MEKLVRPLIRMLLKRIRKMKDNGGRPPDGRPPEARRPATALLDTDLTVNLQKFSAILAGCDEAVIREFAIGRPGTGAAVVFLEGAVNRNGLHDNVLDALMVDTRDLALEPGSGGGSLYEAVRDKALTVAHIQEVREVDRVVETVFDGKVALLLDGIDRAIILSLTGGDYRGVEEPPAEAVVRGPREGFTENISTNIIMVRRRLKSPSFYTERIVVGEISRTTVIIGYIKGIADENVVAEVRKRLANIKVDGILESGEIEEFIEDNPFSPFPTVNHTERPDKVAALLLEGRVAIFVDNTPFVLLVPHLFVELLQASEDYYERWIISSLVRLIRYLALNISVFLPSLYIAVTTFHQEMLPTPLLLNIAGAREGVPFPGFVEAILMEVAFELLREAGVRLPRPVGQAVSIVGALVIGEASVTAGLASPAMVIVVALTGIASFAISGYGAAITMRILRFPLMILAATLGLFGIMMGGIVIVIHAVSLRSFGVPYLSPVAPFNLKDWRDVIVRGPLWTMNTRPRVIGYRHLVRQAPGRKPQPPEMRACSQSKRAGKGGGQS